MGAQMSASTFATNTMRPLGVDMRQLEKPEMTVLFVCMGQSKPRLALLGPVWNQCSCQLTHTWPWKNEDKHAGWAA